MKQTSSALPRPATVEPGWVIVTRRTRNLGIGSTSHVEQTGTGLQIKEVTAADVVGGWKAIAAERDRLRKVYGNSTTYRVAFFLGGKRLPGGKEQLGDLLSELEVSGWSKVCIDPEAYKAFNAAVREQMEAESTLAAEAAAESVRL